MPPKKENKKAAKGYTLPDPIPPGLILCDVRKQQWRLGKSVGEKLGSFYSNVMCLQ